MAVNLSFLNQHRDPEKPAQRLLSWRTLAEDLGVTTTIGDVTDPALFKEVAEVVGEECAGLVYVVGTINLGSLQRLTGEDFLNDFQVNAAGAALGVDGGRSTLRTAG